MIAESPEQMVFRVAVTPKVGSYSALNTEPTKPALVLLGAGRSTSLPNKREFNGFVRSVAFESTDTGLAIRFTTNGPAKVTAEQGGMDRLLVTVSKLSGAEALGSRPVASEGDALGTAHVVPAGPEYSPFDSYEMVLLKYADVSEIVGLLSSGVTVKPNNVFIRREPGFGSMSTTSGTSYVSPSTAVFDRGRALRVLQQLNELSHLWSPNKAMPNGHLPHLRTNPRRLSECVRPGG